jgi:hypothetical protein
MSFIRKGNPMTQKQLVSKILALQARRWMDGDEAGFETYAKRGRKAHVEAEPTTEVSTEVTTEVQA